MKKTSLSESVYKGNCKQRIYILEYFPYRALVYPRSGRITITQVKKLEYKTIRRRPFGKEAVRKVQEHLIGKQLAWRLKIARALRIRNKPHALIAQYLKMSMDEFKELIKK